MALSFLLCKEVFIGSSVGSKVTCLHIFFKGVRVLVDAREKLHIAWGNPANQTSGDKLMAFDTRSAMVAQGMVETQVFLQYLPAIRALWADSGIQNAYDRRREFQLVRCFSC